MRETDPHDELEKSLMRLVPSALSETARAEMEARIDELSGDARILHHGFPRWAKWLGGMAAAVAFGAFAISFSSREAAPLAGVEEDAGMVVLTELDRVEHVRDEGLFVDAGGSAVRKMSVRVVGESRILDEETGIEVTLTEPRKELYLLPVSTF